MLLFYNPWKQQKTSLFFTVFWVYSKWKLYWNDFLIGLINITDCLRLSHWGQDVNSTFIRRLNKNLEVIWSSQFCYNQLGYKGIWKIFKYWYFSSAFAFFPRTLRHSQSLDLAAHGKDKGWQKYPTFSTCLITNSFNNKF